MERTAIIYGKRDEETGVRALSWDHSSSTLKELSAIVIVKKIKDKAPSEELILKNIENLEIPRPLKRIIVAATIKYGLNIRGIMEKCDVCSKHFGTALSLQQHRIFRHELTHNRPRHFCRKCDDKFALYATYSRHVCQQKYLCFKCGQRFFKKRDFEAHVGDYCSAKMSNETRKYYCIKCNEKFAKGEELATHLRLYCLRRSFDKHR